MRRTSPSHTFHLARLPGILLLGMLWVLIAVSVFPDLAGAQERVPGEGFKLYGPEDQGPKPSWRVGGNAFFSSGKYGTDTRTNTLYVPLSLRRMFDNGDLTLVIPYVTVTSNCGVTVVSGE